MRENIGLFKAKIINSIDWAFGSLVYSTKENQYYIVEHNSEELCWAVDEETVCEFTGVKDKNGKLIFENDILSAYGSYDLTVVWDEVNAMFYAEYQGIKSGHEDDDNDDFADACAFDSYEVVGNKFEEVRDE